MKSQTESKPFYKRIGLLGYIVAGMLTGVLAGWGLPDWAVRILVTFNGLFSSFSGLYHTAAYPGACGIHHRGRE